VNDDRHSDERRDFKCKCGSVANCGQSDADLCWYGACRGCGETVIAVPEGCTPGRMFVPVCETCED
jgi:hypothetical protein